MPDSVRSICERGQGNPQGGRGQGNPQGGRGQGNPLFCVDVHHLNAQKENFMFVCNICCQIPNITTCHPIGMNFLLYIVRGGEIGAGSAQAPPPPPKFQGGGLGPSLFHILSPTYEYVG